MSEKFKKGDVVNYRFREFNGQGIVSWRRDCNCLLITVEAEHGDIICFDDDAEHVNPPLNIFDLIREKTV